MTIDYRVVVGQPLSMLQIEQVQKVIRDTFTDVDLIYNKWNPLSEISKVNQLPANTPLQISPKLYDLFILTNKVVRLTEGRFDPTVEPLQAYGSITYQGDYYLRTMKSP